MINNSILIMLEIWRKVYIQTNSVKTSNDCFIPRDYFKTCFRQLNKLLQYIRPSVFSQKTNRQTFSIFDIETEKK